MSLNITLIRAPSGEQNEYPPVVVSVDLQVIIAGHIFFARCESCADCDCRFIDTLCLVQILVRGGSAATGFSEMLASNQNLTTNSALMSCCVLHIVIIQLFEVRYNWSHSSDCY